MVFADVLRQPQVVELDRGKEERSAQRLQAQGEWSNASLSLRGVTDLSGISLSGTPAWSQALLRPLGQQTSPCVHKHAGKAHFRSFQSSRFLSTLRPTKINSGLAEELSGNTRITPCMQANARRCPRQLGAPRFTSGSPVLQLVWMRMVPMRTSLHTARSAGSMVSPARRIDTPVICSTEPG